MRDRAFHGVLGVVLLLSLSCGGGGETRTETESAPAAPQGGALQQVGPGEGEVSIVAWKTPAADCGDGRKECVPYHEWVTSYIAVIGGR